MKLVVRNVRAIDTADIEIGGISLVAGPNRSGKSSVCKALAACLLGAPAAVMPGRSKADRARGIVREGEEEAAAKLTSADGSVAVLWPDETVTTKGDAPTSSRIAAGVERFTSMAHKDRARLVVDLLRLNPSRVELADALGEVGVILGPEDSDRVWQTLKERGWDDAAKSFAEAATKAKGRWEQITGAKKWGATAAATWRPEGYDHVEILTFDAAGLASGLAKAQLALTETLKAEAVSESEVGRLTKLAELEPSIQDGLASTRRHLTELKAEIDLCEPVKAPTTCSCPECGAEVVWQPNGKLGKVGDAPTWDGQAEHEKALKRAELVKVWGQKRDEETRLCSQLTQAHNAQTDLDVLKSKPKAKGTLTPEQARAKVAEAQAHVTAHRQATHAAEAHRSVTQSLAIASVLGPDGVRANKAAEGIQELNRALFALVDETSWPPPTITPSFEVVGENQRPYSAMTPSEQFRVDTVIQLELARRDGSAVAIIDGADIVVGKEDRGDLIEIVLRAEIDTVIGLAVSDPSHAPDLAAAELGRTYHCEGGTARLVGSAAQAEAA